MNQLWGSIEPGAARRGSTSHARERGRFTRRLDLGLPQLPTLVGIPIVSGYCSTRASSTYLQRVFNRFKLHVTFTSPRES